MTALGVAAPRRHGGLRSAVVLATGVALLTARPALVATTGRPGVLLASLFVALALVGLALPIPAVTRRSTRIAVRPATAALVGSLGFLGARLLASGPAPGPLTVSTAAAGVLAAVAEEIWFRRVAYGLLRPGGAVLAVAGSTALFAVVHVPIYGAWILPIDLAAGALLGWQRWATGSWGTSAFTHALANVLVLL